MSVFRSPYWIPRLVFAKRNSRIALVLAAALFASVAPAQAQFFGSWGFRNSRPAPQLTPQEIVQRLSRAGYRVAQLRMNGNVFLADVNDRAGQPMRLVISATDAEILQRFAAIAPRAGGPDGGYSAPPPGFAPSAPGSGEAAPGMRPRAPAARARPAPSEATIAPSTSDGSNAPTAAPPAMTAAPAAAPRSAAPAPIAPMVGPGFANGVPINPLD